MKFKCFIVYEFVKASCMFRRAEEITKWIYEFGELYNEYIEEEIPHERQLPNNAYVSVTNINGSRLYTLSDYPFYLE